MSSFRPPARLTATPSASASWPTSKDGPAAPCSTPPSSAWPASGIAPQWRPTASPATAPGSCCRSRSASLARVAGEAGSTHPPRDAARRREHLFRRHRRRRPPDSRGSGRRGLHGRTARGPRMADGADRRHAARGGRPAQRPALPAGHPRRAADRGGCRQRAALLPGPPPGRGHLPAPAGTTEFSCTRGVLPMSSLTCRAIRMRPSCQAPARATTRWPLGCTRRSGAAIGSPRKPRVRRVGRRASDQARHGPRRAPPQPP